MRTKPNYPTVEQIKQLPCFHQATIPESYLDVMDHMNIQWYMALFDKAGWNFFASFGMDTDYYQSEKGGGFALQQFLVYLAEVHVDESISVHIRLVNRSVKRIHFMLFMVNETTNQLACTMETLGGHADMKVRRTSPYPPLISERLDAILMAHKKLDWTAPLCGVIQP